MAAKKEQILTEKLTRINYPDFEVRAGEEDIPMLFIKDRLICGVLHALSLSDEDLQALIDETVE